MTWLPEIVKSPVIVSARLPPPWTVVIPPCADGVLLGSTPAGSGKLTVSIPEPLFASGRSGPATIVLVIVTWSLPLPSSRLTTSIVVFEDVGSITSWPNWS